MTSDLVELVNIWLGELGLDAGGFGWSLSPLGVAHLTYDDCQIAIEIVSPERRLTLIGELARNADALEDHMLLRLVAANFIGMETGGAILSIDPSDQRLTLGVGMPVEAMDGSRFKTMILGMIDQMQHWKTELELPGSNDQEVSGVAPMQLFV